MIGNAPFDHQTPNGVIVRLRISLNDFRLRVQFLLKL